MQSGDPYNRHGFYAFIFSMVFSLAFFVYVSLIHPGIDLKEIPESAPQTGGLAQSAAPAFDASKVDKPWVSSPEMVEHGKQVFQNTCSACHGNSGQGDGPAAATLVPKPRDLVKGEWVKGGDSAGLFTTLQKGIPGTAMVGFMTLPKVDRWALVHFIHSITTNKVKDDPAKLEKFAATAE